MTCPRSQQWPNPTLVFYLPTLSSVQGHCSNVFSRLLHCINFFLSPVSFPTSVTEERNGVNKESLSKHFMEINAWNNICTEEYTDHKCVRFDGFSQSEHNDVTSTEFKGNHRTRISEVPLLTHYPPVLATFLTPPTFLPPFYVNGKVQHTHLLSLASFGHYFV